MEEIKVLKIIMKRHGLSQEKVARELGISSRTVFRWLHKKNEPSELALIQIERLIEKYKDA